MRNIKGFVLALICIFALTGCGRNDNGDEQSTVDTEIESISDVSNAGDVEVTEEIIEEGQKMLMTITSNGESIYPYLHLAYEKEWDEDENGFIYCDGADPTTVLYDLRAESISLPQLEYADDFKVTMENNVEMKYGFLYDEAMQQLDNDWDVLKVSELDTGVYYIGLLVNEDGDFIEEVQERGYVGWVCFFQLSIN